MAIFRRFFLIAFLAFPCMVLAYGTDALISGGYAPDSTTKVLSEIRAAERRRIPLEVQLKASGRYPAGGPVGVTVIITNLFDTPLVINSRLLVNHPLLQGEISFLITGPSGKKFEIQRLITPLSVRDDAFITLERGQSIQRAVDLSDLFGLSLKGVYKVQVSYHNEIEHGAGAQRAWAGIVWSEPADIRLE